MLYLGTTDAGTNATLWPLGFDLGTNAVSLVTNTVYGLRALKDYYWTVSGSTVSGTVWASSTKTFRTVLSPPAAPSAVSSLGRISLVPTNDYSASVTFSNTSRGTITLTVITNANISAIVTLENQLRQAAETYRRLLSIAGDPTHMVACEAHQRHEGGQREHPEHVKAHRSAGRRPL